MGTTRPSRRQIKKSWVTGSVALGVVAASSGVAMASMQSDDHVSRTSEHENTSVATPSGELCLHLDRSALKKIHTAERQAHGDTAEVRLPAEVVYACPGSTAPPADPSAPADPAPPTNPTTPEPPAPPTAQPTTPTAPTTPPQTTPPPAPTTQPTTPAPTVTSTAS